MDKTSPKLFVCNVKNAKMVKELLSRTVEEERVEKRVSSREYMAADDESEFDEDAE